MYGYGQPSMTRADIKAKLKALDANNKFSMHKGCYFDTLTIKNASPATQCNEIIATFRGTGIIPVFDAVPGYIIATTSGSNEPYRVYFGKKEAEPCKS